MTSIIRKERQRKNRVFVAISGHLTKHNRFEKIYNSFAALPSFEKFVPTSEASAFRELSAHSGFSTVSLLVPKYSGYSF